MKNNLLVIAILLSISSNLISALPLPHFFFPNISSLPSGLLPNISSLPPGLLPNITKSPWEAFHNFTGSHAGAKKAGLSKLKKYFQHFGYININSSSNFTDDFDDTLESAIKTYQRNFNLNVTGELDDATVQMIVRPRCGNEDIINGTSSMNSGKYSSSPSSLSHFHTTGHYSFFPNTPRWPANRYALTYAFLPANQLSETVKTVFSRAFSRWSQVTPLTFTVTDSYTFADIRIGFYSGDHGDGEPFDGVLGTLAHAFSPTNGRFHLDGDESWIVGDITTSTTTTAIDLESVAVHEIGHLLGLGHSSVEGAIMFPTIAAGTRRVDLASDDIAGVQYLYGANPNFNGSNTSSTSIQDTSNGGFELLDSSFGGFMLLIAFGYLLLML